MEDHSFPSSSTQPHDPSAGAWDWYRVFRFLLVTKMLVTSGLPTSWCGLPTSWVVLTITTYPCLYSMGDVVQVNPGCPNSGLSRKSTTMHLPAFWYLWRSPLEITSRHVRIHTHEWFVYRLSSFLRSVKPTLVLQKPKDRTIVSFCKTNTGPAKT